MVMRGTVEFSMSLDIDHRTLIHLMPELARTVQYVSSNPNRARDPIHLLCICRKHALGYGSCLAMRRCQHSARNSFLPSLPPNPDDDP